LVAAMKVIPRETDEQIDRIRVQLEQAGVLDVHIFTQKLKENASSLPNYEDLLVEGQAAVTLAHNGFRVTMRERPDLKAELANASFYAEAKHFRFKAKDQEDEERMRQAQAKGLWAEIGGVVEDDKQAWEQILCVAYSKAGQYPYDDPFVLIIGSSSSHCIEEGEVQTARNEIDDRVLKRGDQDLRKISGFFFIRALDSRWFNISQKRSVYFYPTRRPHAPLTQAVRSALDAIRIESMF
jgi:hypothetical protein